MHYLAIVVLFPLLFWGISLGCGLLVERLAGVPIPALLLMPLGFGLLIVVSQFTTWWGPTAPLTPLILLLLALLGFGIGRYSLGTRWRARPVGWWWAIAAVPAVYVIVAAPEIFAGRVTFSGYLLDTTGAIQIAGAERLLHHAHNFSTGLPAYGTTLSAYFGNGYPSGSHSVLASLGWLSGQDLIWLYSVFQALDLSLVAIVLAFIARKAGLSRPAAAVTGTIAAVPALVYAYALMGSIKEITVLPMIVLMGALMIHARALRAGAGLRAVVPFGVAGAAAFGAIGIAASPWVGLYAAAGLVAAVPIRRRVPVRPLLLGGAGLAIATAFFALPTVARLSKTLTLAEGISNSDIRAVSDPGNLLRPLKFIQTFGVWLGETHRFDPRFLNQTYVLMGVVAVCLVLGTTWLFRRRAWGTLAFVAISLVTWEFLHRHATTWTDAKLLVILSPVVVFVAMIGAFSVARTRAVGGLALSAALVFSVLASDALLYHGTNLAPTQRFEELGAIGKRYAGQGPTLAPDFEEYALYLLRGAAVDSPGLAYSGPFEFVPGVGKLYGHSYDLDSLALTSVERFRTIVMRRSPGWSRPPSNFSLAQSGPFYTVWHRTGQAPREHIPLGAGFLPSAFPKCASVAQLARRATRVHARLVFAPRQQNISIDLATAAHSPSWGTATDLEARPELVAIGPGRIEASFRVQSAGRYELWLGGDVDRPITGLVDGRRVGSVAAQSGDDGTVIDVATVALRPGPHSIQLLRGGGSLRPDDVGSTVLDGIVLEPVSAQSAPVQTLAPARWRSLCRQPLDWLEVGPSRSS
jgi:hypothetical protein